METYTIKDLTFAYPNNKNKAISNISLSIKKGEFITVCGGSGSGKTTFLRQLKPAISPNGNKEGSIYFEKENIFNLSKYDESSKIGFVFQNPDNQIVTDKVWHELAFGLESLGYQVNDIRLRVAEMASFFGIGHWFYKDVSELSGGQKQLLNLASIMAMEPKVLILDEPTSQLDPVMASDFLKILRKINNEFGVTIIISEHKLEEVLPLSDRAIVLDKGKVIAYDTPKRIGEILKTKRHNMFMAMPTPMKIYGEVESDSECPITVREGRAWLDEIRKNGKIIKSEIRKIEKNIDTEPIIQVKDIWFKYEKEQPDILKGLTFSVREGEFYAIVGNNGSGKSTALSVIAGLNKPYSGVVTIGSKKRDKLSKKEPCLLGLLPQNPQVLFVKKTVELDLYEMFDKNILSQQEQKDKIKEISKICELEDLLDRHPYDLSGGEQQRLGLAKVLLREPKILVLDEPTKGMDAYYKEKFANILNKLKLQGITILTVSHDIEFCAEYADYCGLFFDGNIIAENKPQEFFSNNKFYTTAANIMARDTIKGAITAEDVIEALGGRKYREDKKDEDCDERKDNIINKPQYQEQKAESNINIDEESRKKETNGEKATKAISKEKLNSEKETLRVDDKMPLRGKILAMSVFLMIPLTIWFGEVFLSDRKYYVISLLIIAEAIVPFLIIFESKKMKLRKLIVIAVLSALAIAGRGAFFMLPQFKPVAAIIIIAGVSLGCEAGILVGIMTTFVSNFFFGQGPWTPWQMFSFGLIGFLAGALFNKGILSSKRIPLSIYGFLSTFIIYGGLMNISSVIATNRYVTVELVIFSYLRAIPFDLIHAISTFIFLFLISDVLLEKLDRVKIKYGIL